MHRYTNPHTLLLARAALLIGVSGLLCASAQASFTFDAHVVAAGASVQATNACFRLAATVGEPADGAMAGGTFALNAGFRAVVASTAPGEEIFFNGFEACP